jgi:DNA-binding NarL/FixJ family response regulator
MRTFDEGAVQPGRELEPSNARAPCLIVEDNEGFGRALKNSVARWGKVTWTRSFDEAVAAFSVRPFSALIVDVYLGDRSGFDVLSMFRGIFPRTPALVLTGYFEQADSVRACELGAHYVGKPISTDALRAFVDGTRTDAFSTGLFSYRERQILERLVQGDTVKVIAFDLGTAASTVRSLLRRAKRKAGAVTRRELLAAVAGGRAIGGGSPSAEGRARGSPARGRAPTARPT